MAVWARHLCQGLSDLHSLGILHRDITPDNLLLSANGQLKIADFGWAADVRDAPSCLAGTLQYMAPEILMEQCVQTEAVDVWSAGATLLECLIGRPLLPDALVAGANTLEGIQEKTTRLLMGILRSCPLPLDATPACLSPICWDFLRKMLMPKVAHRASSCSALTHFWLQKESPPSFHYGDVCSFDSSALGLPISRTLEGSRPPTTLPRILGSATAVVGPMGLPKGPAPAAHLNANVPADPTLCHTPTVPATPPPSTRSTAPPSISSTPLSFSTPSSPEPLPLGRTCAPPPRVSEPGMGMEGWWRPWTPLRAWQLSADSCYQEPLGLGRPVTRSPQRTSNFCHASARSSVRAGATTPIQRRYENQTDKSLGEARSAAAKQRPARMSSATHIDGVASSRDCSASVPRKSFFLLPPPRLVAPA